jgi:hypothetical protein
LCRKKAAPQPLLIRFSAKLKEDCWLRLWCSVDAPLSRSSSGEGAAASLRAESCSFYCFLLFAGLSFVLVFY